MHKYDKTSLDLLNEIKSIYQMFRGSHVGFNSAQPIRNTVPHMSTNQQTQGNYRLACHLTIHFGTNQPKTWRQPYCFVSVVVDMLRK